MKLFFTLLTFLFIISINSFSQDTSKISISDIDEFPITFGFDFGYGLQVKDNSLFDYSFGAYITPELIENKLAFKIFYCVISYKPDELSFARNLAVGLSYTPYVKDRSEISVEAGGSYYYGSANSDLGIYTLLMYSYRINKDVSFNTTLRFPMIKRYNNNDFYHNPILSAGVKFF